MVREELEGDYFQDGQQEFVRGGDVDDVLNELDDVLVADYGDGDDAAGAAIGWLIWSEAPRGDRIRKRPAMVGDGSGRGVSPTGRAG